MPQDSHAIRHYRRTGTILPGHQGEIAAYISASREEDDA